MGEPMEIMALDRGYSVTVLWDRDEAKYLVFARKVGQEDLRAADKDLDMALQKLCAHVLRIEIGD